MITYPDRRYCFDHFRQGVSFRDAYDVYRKGTTQLSSVAFDFFFTAVGENDPVEFWNGCRLEELLPTKDLAQAESIYDAVEKGSIPDDAHYWIFSDYVFSLSV